MQTVTLTLSGQEFTLHELDIEANAAWRKRFEAAIAPILDAVQGFDQIELETAADLQKIIAPLRNVLLHSPAVLVDLLLAYAPELVDARKAGLKLYESELLAAFVEVLKLAYPFGALLTMMEQIRRPGSATKPAATTPPNSSRPSTRKRRRG